MDANTVSQFITNVGFPITLVLLLLWFLYKNVWVYLVEKMDKITEINEELVRTNRELCSSINIKIDGVREEVKEIGEKVDRVDRVVD